MTWPAIEYYNTPVRRSDIKAISVSDLERFNNKAEVKQWSAVGRPDWLQSHRGHIRDAMLVIFNFESPAIYRCIATLILEDGSGGRFTLDVAVEDFNRLPDIAPESLVTLAHEYLATFPPIELDPTQRE